MLYLPLLLECAWKASIIPFGNDTTFFAMKAFGSFDMRLSFLLAVTGATLGQMFNWGLGCLLLKVRSSGKTTLHISDEWYARAAAFFNTYGLFLLLFSWVPLCNLLVALAGFVGAKPKLVLPLVVAGQLFNYGRHLL